MRNIREVRLARVAARQHTVVGVADLRRARLDRYAVARRVRAGRLHPMFPGTWCLGHPPTTRDAWHMAGVLSAGKGSLLAGISACQQYDVYRRRCGRVHVVRPGKPAEHGRLRIHTAASMPPRRRRNGIPIVPVEEALLGLAAEPGVPDKDVRRAIRQAQVEKLTDHHRLVAHARASAGRRGVTRFRRLVGDRPAPTRSELEDAALDFLRRYGFDPLPNAIVDGREGDFLIGELVVEVDSEAFHDNPQAAEDDAAKWPPTRRVERITWDDIHLTPVRTARRIRRASS